MTASAVPSGSATAVEPEYESKDPVEDVPIHANERKELHARWSTERVDRSWTRESSSRIASQLTVHSGSDTALLGVDCRETICRFELGSRDGAQSVVESLIRSVRSVHEETWLATGKDPSGVWRIEAFFPRDGYRLSSGGGPIEQSPTVTDVVEE